jgi:hypothetical protein
VRHSLRRCICARGTLRLYRCKRSRCMCERGRCNRSIALAHAYSDSRRCARGEVCSNRAETGPLCRRPPCALQGRGPSPPATSHHARHRGHVRRRRRSHRGHSAPHRPWRRWAGCRSPARTRPARRARPSAPTHATPPPYGPACGPSIHTHISTLLLPHTYTHTHTDTHTHTVTHSYTHAYIGTANHKRLSMQYTQCKGIVPPPSLSLCVPRGAGVRGPVAGRGWRLRCAR